MTAVRYHIRHDTLYRYDSPVGESRQMLRLTPRDKPGQHCVSHRITVRPDPLRTEEFTDGFGNLVRSLHFERDHDALFVRAESWIELEPKPELDLGASPAWNAVRDQLVYRAGRTMSAGLQEAAGFLFESAHVRVKHDFAEYAAAEFAPDVPLLVAVDGLMRRIFREFTFDPEATDISTPVTDVLENRRGVCQDFAHLMLSSLRSMGLAARYVSGYILTRPPLGKARLIGADATHAWVSVFCPGLGWVDFDPTNAVMPALEHVTIGWGRDFTDVSPLRGVILGGGAHEPKIAVTMVPENEFETLYTDAEVPMDDLLLGANRERRARPRT